MHDMAKFYGKLGFVSISAPTDGVVVETVVERDYTGDVLKKAYSWNDQARINADPVNQNRISVISDDFAISQLPLLRYVVHEGHRWSVASVENIRPRLILTLGSIYNGPVS